MKTTTTLAIILAASLTACGGSDPKPVTPDPTPIAETTPTTDPATDTGAEESGGTGTAMALEEGKMGKKDAEPPFALVLGEATVYEGSGKAEKAVWKLHADGTTESSGTQTKKKKTTTVWHPSATIKTDGTIEGKGVAVAKLSADGITDLETNQLVASIKIDGNTISTQDDKGMPVTLTLADDGKVTLTGGPMDGKSWRIEAADPAVARTAFLVVGMGMFAPGKAEPAPTK